MYFKTEKETCEYAKTVEKFHGRIEIRTCYKITNIQWLEQKNLWAELSGIGIIVSDVQVVGQDIHTHAVQYVIYSKADISAIQLLESKRKHLSIEYSLHWVLDVDFREDSMRMRSGFAAKT